MPILALKIDWLIVYSLTVSDKSSFTIFPRFLSEIALYSRAFANRKLVIVRFLKIKSFSKFISIGFRDNTP